MLFFSKKNQRLEGANIERLQMSSCCSWHENRQQVAIRKRLQELVRQVCRTAVQDKNAVHTVKQIQSISSYVVNKVTEACLRHPPTAMCLQQQTRGHTIAQRTRNYGSKLLWHHEPIAAGAAISEVCDCRTKCDSPPLARPLLAKA